MMKTWLGFNDRALIFKVTVELNRSKGEFQICPRMDFHNILYVEYLCYNNYKNEITLFLEGC